MGNKLVTRVRNVFGKKSKSEKRSIETVTVKTVKTVSPSVNDVVAETPSKLVEEIVVVSALQDHLGGLEVPLLDSLGNFSRNNSRYVPKPVSNTTKIKGLYHVKSDDFCQKFPRLPDNFYYYLFFL